MAEHNYSVIGTKIPLLDAPTKATGDTRYINDLSFPGMLFGKIIRSPHPHARIRGIDARKALKLPGVRAVVTGKDTPGVKWGRLPGYRDKPALAVDKVRFIGEAVGAVAAVDLDTAEEALELIKVDYEILPAVFDAEEAMKEGAPLVHEHAARNIAITRQWNMGDVVKGFKESDYIREDRFSCGAQMHGHLEPFGSIIKYDSQGKVTIWTCTQAPYMMRSALSGYLGIAYDKIRVINQTVGGGFGGKLDYVEVTVGGTLLSQKTGRPVKIIFTKEEEFIANTRRMPKVLYMKTGFRKDGTIMAQDLRAVTNGGAYIDVGAITIYNTALACMLPFQVPNFKYDALRVYTNNPVCGPQRGHGQNESRMAAEAQLDMAAEHLGIDPVDIRLKNALRSGDVTLNKMRVTTCALSETIKKTAEDAHWKEKRAVPMGSGKGIGMGCSGFACGIRLGTLSDSCVVIKVNEDATVSCLTGDSDIGQGSNTVVAMCAAEVLGISPNQVSVVSADTEICPFAPGTFGSRVTFYCGNAARLAAEDVKRQLIAAAARKFKVPEDAVDFKDGSVWVKGEKRATFAEVVRALQVSNLMGGTGVIVGKGSYTPPNIEFPDRITQEGNISGAYSFASQVAEVEVDKETGQVKLVRMTLGDDGGQPINALSCEGQKHGCVHMGQGQAMYEEVWTEKGVVHNPNLRDYCMPRAMDTPHMDAFGIITDDPVGPFGGKEVGEGFIVSTPAAIVNAIHHATGVWLTDLPITSEKVFNALKAKGKGS